MILGPSGCLTFIDVCFIVWHRFMLYCEMLCLSSFQYCSSSADCGLDIVTWNSALRSKFAPIRYFKLKGFSPRPGRELETEWSLNRVD